MFVQIEIIVLSSHFGQYVADVQTVQKLLQEAERTIVFINKEEDFYKLGQTSYQEVEVIRDSTELYQKLFGLLLNWQRTENRSHFSLMHATFEWNHFTWTLFIFFENRWMDGSFLDLNGESMEVEVDEFFREVFKMLKFFQQKQNKAEQDMKKTAGGPPRQTERKQENPTITLCSTVMEQIKEFKVVYAAHIASTKGLHLTLFEFVCMYDCLFATLKQICMIFFSFFFMRDVCWSNLDSIMDLYLAIF